jgi:hypothetical protein
VQGKRAARRVPGQVVGRVGYKKDPRRPSQFLSRRTIRVRQSANAGNVLYRRIYSTDGIAFIHEGSCECAKSELDLFSLPSTQTSIENKIYVEYHPISNITGGTPLEFDVTETGDDYLDLANSFLCVRAKITRNNGDDLDTVDTAGPSIISFTACFPRWTCR